MLLLLLVLFTATALAVVVVVIRQRYERPAEDDVGCAGAAEHFRDAAEARAQ